MTPIFLFPGQSSASTDIFATARQVNPRRYKSFAEEASEILSKDIAAHYEKSDAFTNNRDIQVGVFLCDVLHLLLLQDAGVSAPFSLGLSLGEYAHLVHIGALEFSAALRLIDERGKVYNEGPDGVMAAVYPVNPEELTPILQRAREKGFVEISNLNSATQQVIAGERAAVEEALLLLHEELFAQGRIIEERIPMHTERFKPASQAFSPALASASWKRATKPYLPNVTAELVSNPSPDFLVSRLAEHVWRPVLWKASIDAIRGLCPDAAFIEVGPKTILYDMLRRDWVGDCKRFHTATPAAFEEVIQSFC